jgi:hypothetical protein
MIMTPEGGVHHGQADLGPAAGLRLWGATEPLWRLIRLPTIMPGGVLSAQATRYDAALARLAQPAHDLAAPGLLKQQLFDTGAIDLLGGHEADEIVFDVGDPDKSPPVIGRRTAGYMDLDDDQEQVEFFEVITDQSTEGRFYAFDASLLQVDRHVKDSGMPITTLGRADVPGASQKMSLPGEQEIPFPVGGGGGLGLGGSFIPGLQWDFDYDVDTSGPMPEFTFKSLTGTLDLTKGGLSGMGFDEASLMQRIYASGDWFVSAGLRLRWSGWGAKGAIFFGSTQDKTPVYDLMPLSAGVLKNVSRVDGGLALVGVRASLIDFGCLLTIGAGVDVGGWYLSESFGGLVRGYVFGDGACLVSVHGDLTLVGAEVNDVFHCEGSFWVAGGIGFCDEEDWDTPADVLDDDFCAACVLRLKMRGRYPPSDLDLRVNGPRVSCSL